MTNTNRLSFLAEWEDPFSSVNWKFHLFFYTSDETIELFDILKHRLFLKRQKCEGVQLEDLYIGATLRIFSRLIYIADFADSYTRLNVDSRLQKICGFLKPDVTDTKGEILKEILQNNFRLINIRTIFLTELEALELFQDYPDETILSSAVQHVISGSIVAFQLLRTNAFIECANLIGPEDPDEARKHFPDSLRARYGVDKINNAIFISASIQAAEKDAKILFRPKSNFHNQNLSRVLLGESVCCVIKPHAVKKGQAGDIMFKIEESGYQIINITMFTMSTNQAEKFLEVYKYTIAEFQEIVHELCSSACIALEIKGETEEKTHSSFRNLVGPMDPEIARCIRSDTIRAIFGETKVRNSIHVTDLLDDVTREIKYFFEKAL